MKNYISTDASGRIKSYTSINAKTDIVPDGEIDVTNFDLPSDFLRSLNKYVYDNGVIRLATDQENADRDFPDQDYWNTIRSERNQLLSECDWTQSPDSPLTDEKKAEWQNYRTALRELPSNTTDPRNPTWPTKPT